MGTQAGCAFTTVLLFGYYLWSNKRRGAQANIEEEFMSPDAWTTLTDKENKQFRYAY